jgi:hypothetical protein
LGKKEVDGGNGQANMAQMIDNDGLEELLELDRNGKPGSTFCFDCRERGERKEKLFRFNPLLRHLKRKLEIFNLLEILNHQR